VHVTSNRIVVLLCGPPGAGKSRAAKASGMAVYDRDDGWSEAEFRRAIAQLRHDRTAHAVVISSGATPSARRRVAASIGATHTLLLMADKDVLRQRIRKDRRADTVARIAGVEAWFRDCDVTGQPVFNGWGGIVPTRLPSW
jgi:shikimate kinase